MMRWIAIVLFSFLILAFESPLLAKAKAGAYAPDLGLIVVLYIAFIAPYEVGLVAVLCVGMFKDAFSMTAPLGLHMEVLALTFVVVHRLSQRIDLRGPVSVLALTAAASIASSFLELGLCLIFDQSFNTSARTTGVVLAAMLPQALLTAPFGPVIFWLLGQLESLTTRKSESIYT
ncbi:MAG: rod shape-determining protein MreD [Deltaproteobacteria bacterium]|nr:rod shape-determining protein MreD [Deltaproteobacteria bacterium]